ncbi:hypothetical protein KO498_06210 [Lentibacter algarum]|uniref:alginate O-acetyltransferase AlgX-related protein n=1 Tax=Lentibacter algarum TaxID=576131 RepID=UPI001C074C61|nr:hypothetical protein [Lentibacter algarum]MBU2981404.1 hypothetical protein [Lentibacter algarum]
MTPDQRTKQPGLPAFARAGLLALLALGSANTAQAQSAYGCSALEAHTSLPAVEGRDGMFFAIRPELQAHQAINDETITLLAQLGTNLAKRGTTLVLLPVPTRAQVFDRALTTKARDVGYDAADATAVHLDMLVRLRASGLTVADARPALRSAATAGEQPYFQTDMRPTPVGTRILAAAVGKALAKHPGHTKRPTANFISAAGAVVTLDSSMRARLQTACQSQLPAVTAQSFTTTRSSGVATNNPENRLVVLGADTTQTEALNLKGFLAEATGYETLAYGVKGGGAFAAMSSYLTSADFQANAPRVLVWEFPVSATFAAQGDQPLKELIAATGNNCQKTLPVTVGPTGQSLSADLSQMTTRGDVTLSVETGGAAPSYLRFHFTSRDGLIRTRSIYRHPDQLLTGRFFLPLSGLNATGLQSVEIEAPAAFGAQSRIAVCS